MHPRIALSVFVALVACASPPAPGDASIADEARAAPDVDATAATDRPSAALDGGSCGPTIRCDVGVCVENQCVCRGEICDGRCVYTSSDPQHCGGCGRVCERPRSYCNDGVCDCPPRTCGASCTAPYDDDDNCGECGRQCGARTRCVGSECVCTEGWGSCGGATDCSTPVRDNPMHCGACDARCLDDERCVGAACVRTACEPGRTACSPSDAPCGVDLATSNQHCGACGRACAAGARCAGARCVSTAITQRMPGSMLQASSARPWFRWTLGEGADGARLEVCLDPECTRREFEVDVTGERYRPTAALPAGIHFWRVFARRGASADSAPSPVWEFEVLDATRPLAPTEPIIDLNGDGVRDTVTGGELAFREYSARVRYGVSPDGARRADDLLRGPMSVRPNPLEADEVSAIGAGDLDGDGLADVLLSTPFRVRQSETQSYGAHRLMGLYGNRVGAPRFGGLADSSTGHNPGPTLEGGLALGNALGISGYLASVGNPPICYAVRAFASPMSGLSPDLSCDGGTLTAGDYDADGRVELIEQWPPVAPGASMLVPLCAEVPWLSRSALTRRSITRDVDLDGYDDLVLWLDATRSYTVYGGPRGLDGTRCTP